MPTWTMRRGSRSPSSTARRNGVPWKHLAPKYASRVPGPDERRLLAHRARAEPRARAVRHATVVRDPDERDVEPLGGRHGGQEHERRDLAEPGRHEGIARLRVTHASRPPPTAPSAT